MLASLGVRCAKVTILQNINESEFLSKNTKMYEITIQEGNLKKIDVSYIIPVMLSKLEVCLYSYHLQWHS